MLEQKTNLKGCQIDIYTSVHDLLHHHNNTSSLMPSCMAGIHVPSFLHLLDSALSMTRWQLQNCMHNSERLLRNGSSFAFMTITGILQVIFLPSQGLRTCCVVKIMPPENHLFLSMLSVISTPGQMLTSVKSGLARRNGHAEMGGAVSCAYCTGHEEPLFSNCRLKSPLVAKILLVSNTIPYTHLLINCS